MPDITIDELWPRRLMYRYRLYVVTPAGGQEVVAAAPIPGGVGVALIELHDDEKKNGGAFSDRGRFGLMDVCPGGVEGGPGEWIVLPYDRGKHT